jgi:hypothetical protein
VRNFEESIINQAEKACLKQCLNKMDVAEKMYVGKLKETMEYLVMNDPALKRHFQESKVAQGK